MNAPPAIRAMAVKPSASLRIHDGESARSSFLSFVSLATAIMAASRSSGESAFWLSSWFCSSTTPSSRSPRLG